jgi:hypothetical protein
MENILPDAQKLVATLKDLMPSSYQQETFQALLGLFLFMSRICTPPSLPNQI